MWGEISLVDMLPVFIQFSSKNFAIFISIWVILQKPQFLPQPNNMTLGSTLLGFGHSTTTGKTLLLLFIFRGKMERMRLKIFSPNILLALSAIFLLVVAHRSLMLQ